MTAKQILTPLALTAALAVPGIAVAQDDRPAVGDAYLVALSGGALLHYELEGTASKPVVTVDGRRAKVRDESKIEGPGVFHALVNSTRTKVGGRYTVTVKVDGKSVFSKRLVVHRRHKRAE